MAQPRILTTNILLGKDNVSIEALDWKCHLTSYGNLCTFEVRVAIATLKKSGYDIFAEQNKNSALECKIIINDQTNGVGGIIFDGIIDRVEGTWEDDILEIEGRDYSAILRDQQVSLVQYANQNISDVVQGIVKEANSNSNTQIQTNITATNQMAGVKSNPYQGEDWSLSTQPKPAWHIIQELADEVGYVAYMDQHQTLNFVPPGNTKSWIYNWRQTPAQIEQESYNIIQLTMTQQSRRYNNFTLWLHGSDADAKQTIWVQKISGDGSGRLLVRRRDDLNASNADIIAQNELTKIQQKNTVAKLVVEGNYNLNLNDQIQVLEANQGDLLGLSGRGLYIVSFVQQFSMPDYGSDTGDGFLTQITCNQLGSSSGSD